MERLIDQFTSTTKVSEQSLQTIMVYLLTRLDIRFYTGTQIYRSGKYSGPSHRKTFLKDVKSYPVERGVGIHVEQSGSTGGHLAFGERSSCG